MKIFPSRFLFHSRRVRWAIRLAGAGLLLVLVAGHPWIIAWLIEGQFKAAGGALRGTRSVSYEHIVWRDLGWAGENFHASLDQLEVGLVPRFVSSWLSPAASLKEERPFISAIGIDLGLQPSDAGKSSPEAMPAEWNRQAAEVLEALEQWLPPVIVEAVRLQAPFGEASVAQARWDGMRLSIRGAVLSSDHELPVEVDSAKLQADLQRLGEGLDLLVKGNLGPWQGLTAHLRTQTGPGELVADGTAEWEGGDFSGQAVWTQEGWAPHRAEAHGVVSRFEGTPLDRADVPEASLTMAFVLEDRTFQFIVDGDGVWESPDVPAGSVPWELAVTMAANHERFRVSRFEVNLPWLDARLDNPIEMDRKTLTPEAAAVLRWETDFTTWPWLTLEGSASGLARLQPEETEGVRFAVTGQAAVAGMDMLPPAYQDPGQLTFDLRGSGNRGEVMLDSLRVDSEKWGTVSGAGSWRAGDNRLEGELAASVTAGALAPLSPDWLTVGQAIEAKGRFSRTSDHWQHSGSVMLPVLGLHDTLPLALELAWQGTERALSSWSLDATSDDTSLKLEGSAVFDNAGRGLTLRQLEESHGGELRWELAEPATLSLSADPDDDGWSLERLILDSRQSPARVEAEGGMASLEAGSFRISVQHLAADDLSGWYRIPNDEWLIERLDLQVTAESGHLAAQSRLAGHWQLPSGERWEIDAATAIDRNGLKIVENRVSSPTAEWLQASGTLPFTIDRSKGGEWRLQAHRDQSFQLNLRVDTTEPLPEFFADRLPFEYENLVVSAEASGTLSALQGAIGMSGDSIEFPNVSDGGLRLEEPTLQVTLDDGTIRMEKLAFRLPGAEARAHAALSIEEIPWEAIGQSEPLQVLEQARISLRSEAFPVAALAPLLPDLLEPTGTVTVELSNEGLAAIDGTVSWEGLNLRPLPNGAVPRNLSGQARLSDRRLEAIELEATISGRSVRASGRADFEHWPEPLFELDIEAERIDLVRQLDLILRARGNFRIARMSLEETPLISGELILEDSLLLRDLRDFTRQGAAGVSRRPPYFSVESDVFADWRLDVGVSGERFMNIQTPVFTGLVSADFQLQGTLGDPAAIGQATIEEGEVLFPFAKIPLTSGRASISLSDPHTLDLYGQGRGIAFGYDVVLQLEGTAREPALTFSSPQGLAQDEIVMMLAAGAVPASDRTSSDATRAGRIALYFGQDIFSSLLGGGDRASRIEIRSGEGFSPYRRNNQVIEYHFNDDWSVLGEHDDFGDYNVDLKRTVYRE